MDQGSPRSLIWVYVAAVVAVAFIITAGAFTLWLRQGNTFDASSLKAYVP
jgi:membrane protein implicated in regulation of membrane protease activity